jgi:hypothetical protein
LDERFEKETPDQVGVPTINEVQFGKIVISHGWDNDDYVWHISTNNTKLPFKVPEKHLIMYVIQVFQSVIPDTCKVDIWTPDRTWDLKMYTFKAWKLRDYWQITPEILDTLLKKLFATANALV